MIVYSKKREGRTDAVAAGRLEAWGKPSAVIETVNEHAAFANFTLNTAMMRVEDAKSAKGYRWEVERVNCCFRKNKMNGEQYYALLAAKPGESVIAFGNLRSVQIKDADGGTKAGISIFADAVLFPDRLAALCDGKTYDQTVGRENGSVKIEESEDYLF